MAYRLERDESVISGLKRVVNDEIESAGRHLQGRAESSRDKAVHEARKSIKKVRALLRLMRAELGDTFGRENSGLRDIAHRLSDLRDAFVMIETLDRLGHEYAGKSGGKLRSIRAGLEQKRAESVRSDDVTSVLDEAAAALEKAGKRVKSWPLETDGFRAIAPGFETTYRTGRKALKRAHKDPRPDVFHDLRKRVKDHWYHVRLLENLWTEMMKAYEKSLKELETALGDDHNLAVLRDRVLAEPTAYGRQEHLDFLFDLIEKAQKDLRDRALALADRIYDEKPRELTRRMSHLWETWRHEPADFEHAPTAA